LDLNENTLKQKLTNVTKTKMKSSTIFTWMHVLLMGIVFLTFLIGEIEGGIKAGVTKNRGGKGRGRGGGSRKTMADRMKTMDENGNPVEGGSDDYVEPCVGVCQYHREIKWKRDNGITDPPVPSTTTEDPASRTTKDYGRHAKEIGRGSAVPGVWPGRSPGTYLALIGSVVSATFSSFVIECTVSQQLYYSGGGKWAPSLNPL